MSNIIKKYNIRSQSNPNLLYVVAKMDDGTYECSCPAWIHHFPRKDCKHIRGAIATEKLEAEQNKKE